jgi:hypothetical protein
MILCARLVCTIVDWIFRPLHEGWHVLSILFTLPADPPPPPLLYIRVSTTAGRTRGLRFAPPAIADAQRFAYWRHRATLSGIEWPRPTPLVTRKLKLHAIVPFLIRDVAYQIQAALKSLQRLAVANRQRNEHERRPPDPADPRRVIIIDANATVRNGIVIYLRSSSACFVRLRRRPAWLYQLCRYMYDTL